MYATVSLKPQKVPWLNWTRIGVCRVARQQGVTNTCESGTQGVKSGPLQNVSITYHNKSPTQVLLCFG